MIHTVKALSESGNQYMLTGSLVSSMQGEPRATHDIDIVVEATAESMEAFLGKFPIEDYYYDSIAAKRAIAEVGMFNILSATGDKVDIWTLGDTEFDQSRFSRRQRIEFLGHNVNVSSPEDTILMKLLWSKQSGGGEKQLFDAAKVYEFQRDVLDNTYLETWISKLELKDQFAALHCFL